MTKTSPLNLTLPFSVTQLFKVAQYKQLTTEVILPSTPAKRSQWVISRALCIFELVDLTKITPDDRVSALNFHLKKSSPFLSTDFHCEWENGFAMLWMWDKNTINKAIEEQAINVFEKLPETVFRKKTNTGLALLPTLNEGFELQFWVNNILLSSSYFPVQPNDAAISTFLKGLPRLNQIAYQLPKQLPKTVQPNELLTHQWKGEKITLQYLKGLNFEPVFAFILLTCSIAYIQWQTMAVLKVNSAIQTVEQSTTAAFNKAKPIANARANALKSQQNTQQIHQLIGYPNQQRLMLDFGTLIKEKEGQLIQWNFNQNKLELTVKTKNSNSLDYVNSFQTLSAVKKVSTEQVNQTNHLKIIIELS